MSLNGGHYRPGSPSPAPSRRRTRRSSPSRCPWWGWIRHRGGGGWPSGRWVRRRGTPWSSGSSRSRRARRRRGSASPAHSGDDGSCPAASRAGSRRCAVRSNRRAFPARPPGRRGPRGCAPFGRARCSRRRRCRGTEPGHRAASRESPASPSCRHRRRRSLARPTRPCWA